MIGVHPRRAGLVVLAVTGTDGKTTTTTMIDAILRAAGKRVLRVTTLGAFVDGESIGDGMRTWSFDRALDAALARGVDHVALEVTSHALSDGFAKRFPPDVAVLTSFSRDHLDHHGTPEHYLASKSQLFLGLPDGGTAVLPTSEAGDLIAELAAPRRTVRFGVDREATLIARDVRLDAHGVHASLFVGDAPRGSLSVPLYSRVHAENALGAVLATEAIGIGIDLSVATLACFGGVPGRMERIWAEPLVFVDFAHTPNALRGTLEAARSLGSGRVHLVFGCGGRRDEGKRPEMGRIASELADSVILTSDNPRHEAPAAIADAIETGMTGPAERSRELDRKSAIERAIEAARPGDVVILAGKGHETTQEIGGLVRPFSDLDVARAACQRLHPHAPHRP